MLVRDSRPRGAVRPVWLAVGANVAGAWPLGRRLFVETDALALIQLVEASLNRAAVKKPLLSTVVANEPESSVPHEPLDATTRHPGLLEHSVPRSARTSSFIPLLDRMNRADLRSSKEAH